MHSLSRSLIAALLLSATFIMPAGAETTRLTFLLTNDIYRIDNDGPRGGFARLNAVVKAERAKGGNVIYAHAGDLISPSLLSGLDQGEHTIALTNLAPPDIFTPGNHEYDFGEAVFLKRMAEAKFPVFAANLRTAGGLPVDGIKDTELRTIGGLKIGFVGLTADDAQEKSSPGPGLVFADTFETALARAKDLKAEGADLIVAVAHADREVDMKLYQSGDFDIILSGDDHDLALLFDGNTVLAESMTEANYVTAIDVTVDVEEKDGKRSIAWWPDFRVIDTATVTPDPETQAQIDAYNAELDKDLNVAIGTTTEPLDSRKGTVRMREAAIGNLITDAIRATTGADAAILNGGGIRGNTQYAAGAEITRRDILTELPFGNRTVKLEVTGATIKSALENGVSDAANAAGRFPQVSGLIFTADLTQPPGQRVSAVTVGGRPLDLTATYTLATNDYMAKGGDGYTALVTAKPLLGARDGKLMANDVMVYITKQKTVAPKVEGRIILRM
ncbi:bifunctional metallophosphatase/5'-nucleotidase [Aestuariivirga sp.]|uniref:bifunctional metallophosphatase/5'-nucleotidase n=1 Tax=Aestuariivirga sp. TaxID=2650926 RepID=UPI003BA8900C